MTAAAEATIVDCDTETSPGRTFTIAVPVTGVPLTIADTVLAPTSVELRVPVATPLALVGPAGCTTVFPAPVAARLTVAPPTGLPKASIAVTLMVEVNPPLLAEIGRASCRERV